MHLRARVVEHEPSATALRQLIGGRDPVRRQLGLELTRLGRLEQQLTQTARLTSSPHAPTATYAIRVLGEMASPSAITPLGRIALIKNPDRQTLALHALGKLAAALPDKQRPAILEILAHVQRTSPPPQVRRPLLRALRRLSLPECLPLLAGFLADSNASLAHQAALGCTQLTALDISEKRMDDRQSARQDYVRRWRGAIRAVQTHLASGSWPRPDTSQSARIDRWIPLLGHERHALRKMARQMLEQIGRPALIALRKARTHPSNQVRQSVRELLSGPTLRDPVLLLRWIRDKKLENTRSFRENLMRYGK